MAEVNEVEEQVKAIEQAANESMQFEQVDVPGLKADTPEPKTAEILHPVLMMGFGVIAPNWQISDEEAFQLAEVYGQLIDKYFPDGMGNYGAEITAVMVTGAIVLPRLKTPRKIEPKEDEQKAAA